MNVSVEFLMWLAQNNPDCLNQHADAQDWGKKAFENLFKQFLSWRKDDSGLEDSVLRTMQEFDERLAETDYNIGFLNGMEQALAVLQGREPALIATEHLVLPGEALKIKSVG